MALDTATVSAIGVELAGQVKDELVSGAREMFGSLTAEDRALLIRAVDNIGLVTAMKFSNPSDPLLDEELRMAWSVLTDFKDVGRIVAARITKEKIQAIAMDILGSVIKIGGSAIGSIIPLPI